MITEQTDHGHIIGLRGLALHRHDEIDDTFGIRPTINIIAQMDHHRMASGMVFTMMTHNLQVKPRQGLCHAVYITNRIEHAVFRKITHGTDFHETSVKRTEAASVRLFGETG